MTVRLDDVYAMRDSGMSLLYQLLEERAGDNKINISHQGMPSWEEHCRFVLSRPYERWYIIAAPDGDDVGAVYLTKNDEIGVFLFRGYQGHGYGSEAVREIMRRNPRPSYKANINPRNETSRKVFERMGFELIQNTFEFVSEE